MTENQDYETIADVLMAMRKREDTYFDYHSPSRSCNHDNDRLGYEESYNDDKRLGGKSKSVRSRRNMTTNSMPSTINSSQSLNLDTHTSKIRNGKRNRSCYSGISKKPLRHGIVDFVFQAVDYYDENREVAQVTMNLIDRLLVLPYLPLLTTSRRESGSSSDCFVGSNHASYTIDWNAIILLCLDLAIKMFSPTSGSGSMRFLKSNSNNSNDFSSTRLSPPETNETKTRTPYITDLYHSISVIMGGSSSSRIYTNDSSACNSHVSSSYTTAQLSSMQIQICKSLSFHLNPPTCAAFIQYLLHLVISSTLSHSGSSRHNQSGNDSDNVSMMIPSSLLHEIADAAYMQVELSVFDDEDHYYQGQGGRGLSCVKSSIRACAALLNAATQLLPHHCHHQRLVNRNSHHAISSNNSNKENINSTDHFDTTSTTGQVPTASCFKSHLRQTIESILCLDPSSVDMIHIRRGLFHMWKENNPDMIRCDDLELIGTMTPSLLYLDSFNKQGEDLQSDKEVKEKVEQVVRGDGKSDDMYGVCSSDPPMLHIEEASRSLYNHKHQDYNNDVTLEKDGTACTPTVPSSLSSLHQYATHPISVSSCTPVLGAADTPSTNDSVGTKRQKKDPCWLGGGETRTGILSAYQ